MAGLPPPGGPPPPGAFGGPGGDRKRGPGDFGGGSGGEGGWRKRPRFEEPVVPPATLRVLVRNSDAGGIIGKGGENIKRLRKQFDCQVMLPDSAGAPERVMTMMGSIDACLGVLADVLKILGMDSGMGDSLNKEVQILIPQPFMGTIIGTGGAKIKELRSRTTAKIKIFMEPMPNSNERSIQIIGSHDQIIECIQHFLQEIGKVYVNKEPREPIFLYEPGAPSFNDFSPRGRGGGGFSGRGRGRGGGQGGFGGESSGGGWRGGRGGGRGRGGRGGGGRGGHGNFNGSHRGGRGGGFMGQSQSNQYNPPPAQQGGGNFGGGAAGAPPPPSVGYSQAPPPAVGYDQQQQGIGGPPPMPQSTGGQPGGFPQPPQLLSQQPAPPRQTQQVTIPNEYVDAIMGPGGSNLGQIKSQSGCDISIEPPKPASNERIISIYGSSTDIQRAQQLLQKSVRDKYPNV